MPYTIEQSDIQLAGTSAAIRYTLSFAQAGQHLVCVTIEVDTDAAQLVFALPNWLPGSYKVRDFVSNQSDVQATDMKGAPLAMEWIAKNRLSVTTGGARTVRLRYLYYGNERSVRHTHINRFHAFISTGATLMLIEGRTDEIHHVTFEHPWTWVSTSLSPVKEGTYTYGALNYDILADSPVEIGNHYVQRYERHGAMHEIAITGRGDFEPEWLVEETKVIIDHAMRMMWKSLPYDRYLFIIQFLPGQYGGLEHARCSVNMFDGEIFTDKEKVVKLLTLLCHEYFHLWNVKRIRPVELGPFDYNVENYTRMLWLAEGATSYYDNLTSYRCGFLSRAEYLKTLGEEQIGRLLDTPGRSVMSIKDSSYLAWVKLYLPTADSSNRFPSYYLKGGVIFLLLDCWIIAQTGAEKSLDDGMRALYDLYVRRPERGVTEEEFIEVVSKAVGVDIGATLRPWLNGTEELPIEKVLANVGLAWREKERAWMNFGDGRKYQPIQIPEWTGLKLEDGKTGPRVVRVTHGSPAEAAGIGLDDEVIALNGYRITSARQWEVHMRVSWRFRENGSLKVLASSEGRLYETEIESTPRQGCELVEIAGVGRDVERNRDKWLRN